MEKKLFEKYERDQITDDILREASQLFSKNYGIWGKEAARVVGPFAKEGMVPEIALQYLLIKCG